ncbi:MAG: hypothetical protein KKB50_03365, partial [Planctomycetes bacterium]|nr:hypothetical protein [Planctomycetota bacterium]
GSFECSDMNLQYDEGVSGDDWLVIGYGLTTQQIENTIHTGNINLNGTLGGRVYVRGRSDLNIDVDTINAAVAVGRQMLAQRGKKSDPYLHPAASESA